MKSASVCAILVTLTCHSTAAAVLTLDQVHEPAIAAPILGAGNVGAANTVAWSQTFTVGYSGQLAAVDVLVNRQAVVSQPLLIDVRTVAGDVPTMPDAGANILTSGSLPASAVPVAASDDFVVSELAWVKVDLPDVPVTPGQVLALVLRSDDPGGVAGVTYFWANATDPGYPDGQLAYRSLADPWEPSAGFGADMAFRTYVDLVPEPTAWTLSALAVAFMASRLRQPSGGANAAGNAPFFSPPSRATRRREPSDSRVIRRRRRDPLMKSCKGGACAAVLPPVLLFPSALIGDANRPNLRGMSRVLEQEETEGTEESEKAGKSTDFAPPRSLRSLFPPVPCFGCGS